MVDNRHRCRLKFRRYNHGFHFWYGSRLPRKKARKTGDRSVKDFVPEPVPQSLERNQATLSSSKDSVLRNVFHKLVDDVSVSGGSIKLYKNGKRVSKLAISNAANLRKQTVCDWLQKEVINGTIQDRCDIHCVK